MDGDTRLTKEQILKEAEAIRVALQTCSSPADRQQLRSRYEELETLLKTVKSRKSSVPEFTPKASIAPPPEATRKCPFCAELIRAEAVKCRFCGEFLDGSRRPETTKAQSQIHAGELWIGKPTSDTMAERVVGVRPRLDSIPHDDIDHMGANLEGSIHGRVVPGLRIDDATSGDKTIGLPKSMSLKTKAACAVFAVFAAVCVWSWTQTHPYKNHQYTAPSSVLDTFSETLHEVEDRVLSTGPATLEEFNRLRNGMSYREVVRIIGEEGTVFSESSSPDIGLSTPTMTMVIYSWEGNGGVVSNMNATFWDGKLMGKAQLGLR